MSSRPPWTSTVTPPVSPERNPYRARPHPGRLRRPEPYLAPNDPPLLALPLILPRATRSEHAEDPRKGRKGLTPHRPHQHPSQHQHPLCRNQPPPRSPALRNLPTPLELTFPSHQPPNPPRRKVPPLGSVSIRRRLRSSERTCCASSQMRSGPYRLGHIFLSTRTSHRCTNMLPAKRPTATATLSSRCPSPRTATSSNRLQPQR